MSETTGIVLAWIGICIAWVFFTEWVWAFIAAYVVFGFIWFVIEMFRP